MPEAKSFYTCLITRSDTEFEQKYEKVVQVPALRAYLVQDKRNRQLKLARASWIGECAEIAQLCHQNLAAIHCIYEGPLQKVLIQDYLEINLLDLPRITELTEVEVASAITQCMNGFEYLGNKCPSFLFDELYGVRVSITGVVKIALNYDFDADITTHTNLQYWLNVCAEIVWAIKPTNLTESAHHFFHLTKERGTMERDHPFLEKSQGQRGLIQAAIRASGILLARRGYR